MVSGGDCASVPTIASLVLPTRFQLRSTATLGTSIRGAILAAQVFKIALGSPVLPLTALTLKPLRRSTRARQQAWTHLFAPSPPWLGPTQEILPFASAIAMAFQGFDLWQRRGLLRACCIDDHGGRRKRGGGRNDASLVCRSYVGSIHCEANETKETPP